MTEQNEFMKVKRFSIIGILDGISNLLIEQDFLCLTKEEQEDIMDTPLKELIEIIRQTNAIKSINEDIGR